MNKSYFLLPVIVPLMLISTSVNAGTIYSTEAATNITNISAQLNGYSASTIGISGEIFSYGLTTDYGLYALPNPQGQNGPVSATVTNLQCSSTYHFKFTGDPKPPRTTSQGADLTFNTQACICTDFTEVDVAQTNIIQGIEPILVGTYGVGGWGNSTAPALASTLTDNLYYGQKEHEGIIYGENQAWDINTLWWSALEAGSENNSIEIELGAFYSLDKFIIQADTNDDYQVEYFQNNAWHSAWTATPAGNWGMVTRYSGVLNAIATNKIRISASGGDSLYAISEIAVFGKPVICNN
ncbi:hypothetical protein [Pseudoalteromonas denitrificans]|uniref:F5/8 type C domain-containing protein n=1 Tax=Pseudoalteromonas denitrificans DSM 6059 TaxID=1123010 RepID=A0A1I1TNQ7_9GAMM|nr:hypothetical protein [Pseudoalteromonas denitrificans]SFD60114.1 hypothetical protein SAMN02745724_04941 [Pseudoalteromonas denitrificans DSM 6059]